MVFRRILAYVRPLALKMLAGLFFAALGSAATIAYYKVGMDLAHAVQTRSVQELMLTLLGFLALNLVKNQIYVEWASHGDNGPYHGWVVVWDVSNVKTTGFKMTGVLNTSPNNGLAGIWQGSGRLRRAAARFHWGLVCWGRS